MDEKCCPLCKEPLDQDKTVRLRTTKYRSIIPDASGVIESERKLDAEVHVTCFVARIESLFYKNV